MARGRCRETPAAVCADRDAGLGPGLSISAHGRRPMITTPRFRPRRTRLRSPGGTTPGTLGARPTEWTSSCCCSSAASLAGKQPGWTSEVLRQRSVSGPGKHADLCPRSPRAGARVTPRGGGSSTGVLVTPSAAWRAAGPSRGSDTGRGLPAQRRGVPPWALRVTDGRLFHGVRDANGSNRRQLHAAKPVHRREQSATACPGALLLHRHVETRSRLMWWSLATSRPVGGGFSRLATMTSHDQ